MQIFLLIIFTADMTVETQHKRDHSLKCLYGIKAPTMDSLFILCDLDRTGLFQFSEPVGSVCVSSCPGSPWPGPGHRWSAHTDPGVWSGGRNSLRPADRRCRDLCPATSSPAAQRWARAPGRSTRVSDSPPARGTVAPAGT